MTAILNEEPPDFTGHSGAIAPALERIIRHCMEKDPAQRFQSAHDIAFALESLSEVSQPAAAMPGRRTRWVRPALAGLVLLAAGLALGLWLRPVAVELHPKLHRITFRRGTIWNARFTPDGNIIYGGAWEGRGEELFASEHGSTESRSLGLQTTDILAISGTGDLAVSTNRHFVEGFESAGMLARAVFPRLEKLCVYLPKDHFRPLCRGRAEVAGDLLLLPKNPSHFPFQNCICIIRATVTYAALDRRTLSGSE